LPWCRFNVFSPEHFRRAVAGGVVEGGLAYEKTLTENMTKLQRLYGEGDLTKFPAFKFQGGWVGVCVCVCVCVCAECTIYRTFCHVKMLLDIM